MSIRDILQEPAVDGVVHLAIALGVIVYCLVGFRRAGHRLRYGIILPIGVVLLFGAVLRLAGAARVPWLDVVGGVIALLVFLGLCLGYLVLTVFLLVNGVTIMRKEGRRPATLLSFAAGAWMVLLPALPVVLAATGALRRDVVLVVFAAIYSVVFAATAYVAFFFLGFLISAVGYRKLARRFAPDAIIVLGAGLKGEEPTPLLAGRLDRGLEVYHRETARGRAPVMIPSGGQGPDEVIPEGEAMRRYLADRGVPAEHLRPETRSTTTLENLLFSRELLDDPARPVVVATSDYHVYRAAMFLRKAGLRGRVVGSRTAGYYVPSAFLREYAAVLVTNRWAHLLAFAPIVVLILAFYGVVLAQVV
ncbi:YdcF family protein [Rothia kristinae]